MEWGFTYIAIYVVCIKMSTPCIALMLLQIIVSNWKEGQRNIITHCCLHLVLHYKCNKQNTTFYLYNMSLSLCCDIWRKFKLRLSITEEKGQWGCFSTSSDGSAQLSTMTKTIRMMRKRHEKTNCGKWGWVAQRLSLKILIRKLHSYFSGAEQPYLSKWVCLSFMNQ